MNEILDVLYRIIKLYKPHIDRWIVKTFIIGGIGLLSINIPWYYFLFIKVVKIESQKHLGTEYGLASFEWISFISGWLLIIIGLGIYILNKKYEKKTNILENISRSVEKEIVGNIALLRKSSKINQILADQYQKLN